MENQYFATKDDTLIIAELRTKITAFYADLSAEGLLDLTQRLHKAYYGGDTSDRSEDGLFASSKIRETGRMGSLKKYKANHFRNVIQHILQLATSQRIAYNPQATNTDYKSLQQTKLARGVLDYYLKEQRLESKYKDVLEKALVLLEGWLHLPWEEEAGELVESFDEEGDIRQGDVKASTYSLLDVVRDITTEQDDHDWLMVRTYENKFNLAAEFPTIAEDILNADHSIENTGLEGFESFRSNLSSTQESPDMTVVWVFYHRPTPALPNGRMVKFVGDVLLQDTPFVYSRIPLIRVTGSKIMGTGYGYSVAADLLGPQKALDIVNTQAATNQFNLGIQSVWAPTGDTPNITELANGGMNLYQSAEKPEPLNLSQINPETFKLKESYQKDIEDLSGINSTVRGNPPGANMSGAAQALLVSQSVAFNSMLESSYFEMVSEGGTLLIDNLKRFSKTDRLIAIMGESNRSVSEAFNAEDLSQITRVTAELGNPMMRTSSGRIELAQLMQNMGIQITPYQFLNIIETGSLQAAVEGSQNEYLTIRAENEVLRKGEIPPVIFSDNHPEHIKEHLTVIADPESRKNPELVTSVLTHVQEHINVWKQTPAELLNVLGIPPIPQQPMMPPEAGSVDPNAIASPQDTMPNQPNLPDVPDEAPADAQQNFDERSMT